MNASTVLAAAVGVLRDRGRCVGSFHVAGGSVDVMGALAVAVELNPDVWMGLREMPETEISGELAVLVDAARHLSRAALPLHDADGPVNDLVGVLGEWHDRALDADIYAALAKASEQADPTINDDEKSDQ